jgi:hypothetical protein
MIIEKPKSLKDLEDCICMYFHYDQGRFLNLNFKKSLISLQTNMTQGAQLRLIRENDEIVAWILFKVLLQDFSGEKVVQQTFYCSSTTKIKAVKYVVALHDEMVSWGKSRGLKQAVSTASHEDTTFQLCRILERVGWRSRGYIALKDIE